MVAATWMVGFLGCLRRGVSRVSRILVVGSCQGNDADAQQPSPVDAEGFRQLCEQIGRKLALQGHEIVVCSSSARTADYQIVRGASQELGAGKPSVRYFISLAEREGAGGAYSTTDFPNVRCELRLTHTGWFASYRAAIDYADAVIAIGGTARGTGGACYMALQKSKPVLGIPAADGFAAEVWREFSSAYAALPDDLQLSLDGSDPSRIADAAVSAVEILIEANPFADARTSRRLILMPLAMLALGGLWVYFCFLSASGPTWLSYVLAVDTAMAGMLFRFVTDDERQQVAYAGAAKWYKEVTRVLGAVFGVFIVVNIIASQFHLPTMGSADVLATWFALAGFACGFLVEQVTGILTKSIEGAVGGILGGSS